MSLSLNELSISSWQRRNFARHYPYFDSAQLTTLVGYTEATALASALQNLANKLQQGNTWYQYGTNTKAKIINIATSLAAGTQNWPTGCYGREILMYCTQDAYIQFIVVNPEYLKELVIQAATNNQKRTSSNQLLYEKEFFLPAENYKRRFLFYGYGIVYRASAVQGTLHVDIEASVAGDES